MTSYIALSIFTNLLIIKVYLFLALSFSKNMYQEVFPFGIFCDFKRKAGQLWQKSI